MFIYWAFPVTQLISCESLWWMPYVEKIIWPRFSVRQLLSSSANTGGEAEAQPGCSRAQSRSRCWDWAECRLWGQNLAWGRHSVDKIVYFFTVISTLVQSQSSRMSDLEVTLRPSSQEFLNCSYSWISLVIFVVSLPLLLLLTLCNLYYYWF